MTARSYAGAGSGPRSPDLAAGDGVPSSNVVPSYPASRTKASTSAAVMPSGCQAGWTSSIRRGGTPRDVPHPVEERPVRPLDVDLDEPRAQLMAITNSSTVRLGTARRPGAAASAKRGWLEGSGGQVAATSLAVPTGRMMTENPTDGKCRRRSLSIARSICSALGSGSNDTKRSPLIRLRSEQDAVPALECADIQHVSALVAIQRSCGLHHPFGVVAQRRCRSASLPVAILILPSLNRIGNGSGSSQGRMRGGICRIAAAA